jgi:hypothetical protein
MILFVNNNSGILFLTNVVARVIEILKLVSIITKELIVKSWMN